MASGASIFDDAFGFFLSIFSGRTFLCARPNKMWLSLIIVDDDVAHVSKRVTGGDLMRGNQSCWVFQQRECACAARERCHHLFFRVISIKQKIVRQVIPCRKNVKYLHNKNQCYKNAVQALTIINQRLVSREIPAFMVMSDCKYT